MTLIRRVVPVACFGLPISEGCGRCDEGTSRLREMARERSERVHRPAAKWTEEQTSLRVSPQPSVVPVAVPRTRCAPGAHPPAWMRSAKPWLRNVGLLWIGAACCSKPAIRKRPSSVVSGYQRGGEGVECSGRWPGARRV